MTPGRLHVAIATDRPLPAWQARCVEAVAAVPGVTIDHWLERSVVHAADGQRDAGARMTVPAPDVLHALGPASDAVAGDLSEAPLQTPVDVLLDLTSEGIVPAVPWASEVWHFAYGTHLGRNPDRAALVGYIRSPGVVRVALVSEPTGAIVRGGWLQAVSWWNGKPLDRLLTDPLDWPATAARRRLAAAPSIDASDDDRSSAAEMADGGGRRASLVSVPAPLLEVAAAGRRMRGWVDVLTRHPDWNIGLIDAPIEQVSGLEAPTVRWLPLRRDHFAADPFGIERDGFLHIFFEDFDQRTARGVIGHVAMAADGTISAPEVVLDPGVHASYPFLVEHDGTIFMLPETSAAGELVLYEAVDFPHRWRPAATILPGIPAADATIVPYDGRWWMFATRADRGANQNLFVWHAATPMGPWLPHALNPVKTDARSARPAGTPFMVAGRLHRPSQDNARIYGGRVVVNEVEILTPTDFAERRVGFVQPWPGSPYPDGLHTLSAVGGRTLIDGNRRHLVRGALRSNLESKLPRRRR
jgi:hypothetical protein